MKILAVNWRDIGDPLGGGAELHLHEILKGAVAAGHEVDLVVSAYAGAPSTEVVDGVRIHRKGHWSVANYVLPGVVKGLLKAERYDLIVEDINKIPFYTPLYSGGVPVLAVIPHLFGTTVFRETNPLVATYVWGSEQLIPAVYRNVHFEVISPSTADDLTASGVSRDRVTTVFCGMDHGRFNLEDPPARDYPPLVVSWSRLRKYKSVDVAVDAFTYIHAAIPEARMLIMGRGPDENRLRKHVESHGLADIIEFSGHLEWNDLVAVLHRASVFLNPSPKEGWGLTVIEANCCGLPVVASDRPGLVDSVQDGETGLLVPYGDPDAMADAALMLLRDPELWRSCSENARTWADTFTWERCVAESLDLFAEVAAKGVRP